MITQLLTRIFTSRPVKLLLVLFVLLAAASQAVPQLVDSKPYVERLAAVIRETSGATLLVKGGSHLQVIPRPALVLKSLEISQPNVEHSPSVGVDAAEFSVDILSIFSGAPWVNGVRVAGVSLVAEKLPAGGANWGFLGMPLLKTLAAAKSPHPVHIEILSGHATVGDAKTGETYGISQMQAAGDIGNEARLSGTLTYRAMPVQFSLSRNGVMGATPVTLTMASGGNRMALNGTMDFTADTPVVTGKVEIASADISQFLGAIPEEEKPPAMPLKINADYVQKEGLVALSGLKLEALDSKATGSLEWYTSKPNDYKLSLNFSTLELTSARKLVGAYLASMRMSEDSHAPKTLAKKSLNMAMDITAESIVSGAQNWNRATFAGTLAAGALTVNKLAFALPGDSTLVLFGLISVSDTQGLRFEGNTEAKGSSLRDLLTVFDESAANLPLLGFGAYSLHSNLFISRELLRLSEADAKFSELGLKGGLVAYFDKKPRIESEVALRDINFDYFRDSWRSNAAARGEQAGKDDLFLRFDRDMNFDWLKKLSASIDFTVSVQGFTFLERKGSGASFRLFAQGGEVGIYNAKFVYGQDTTEASLRLDVTGGQPNLNLVLNTAEVNTNYFVLKPAPPEPVAPAAVPAPLTKEALPDMAMPAATAEEELRQKIREEAAQLGAPAAVKPVPEATPQGAIDTPKNPDADEPPPVDLKPLTEKPGAWNLLRALFIREALAQEAAAPDVLPVNETSRRWSETMINTYFMEGIGGTFDISVGKLQHKNLLFQNFKMLAKLERDLLTFQTLTFAHWGGSFSINGTVFGGKVPGLSLGFIIASIDIKQMLNALLHIDTIGGRTSISGTIDTSGLNMLSWISQATAKLLVAGRSVNIRGFDMASVLNAVAASRTAPDIFNNVNLAVVGGTGDYSADGAVNMQKGIISTPGIALKTGRVVGNVTGDFRLIPWDINLSGAFKFPELSTENVPTMTVRWSGQVDNPSLQTDTQSLEAFVSKRITGN